MIDYMVEEMLLNAIHEQQRLHAGSTPADHIGDGMRLAILVEEVGEVANELQAQEGVDSVAVARELSQVAAVAVSWLEWLVGNCLKITVEVDGKEWVYLGEERWRSGGLGRKGLPAVGIINCKVENL